jgi:hypothetical protein
MVLPPSREQSASQLEVESQSRSRPQSPAAPLSRAPRDLTISHRSGRRKLRLHRCRTTIELSGLNAREMSGSNRPNMGGGVRAAGAGLHVGFRRFDQSVACLDAGRASLARRSLIAMLQLVGGAVQRVRRWSARRPASPKSLPLDRLNLPLKDAVRTALHLHLRCPSDAERTEVAPLRTLGRLRRGSRVRFVPRLPCGRCTKETTFGRRRSHRVYKPHRDPTCLDRDE